MNTTKTQRAIESAEKTLDRIKAITAEDGPHHAIGYLTATLRHLVEAIKEEGKA